MKTIKNLLLLSLGVVLFASCEKNPDLSKLDGKNTVYTNYKSGTDFKSYTTFFVNDTVYALGGENGTQKVHKWAYDTDSRAKALNDNVTSHMKNDQYTQITDRSQRGSADLGIQITWVEDMNYFISYYYPYWWDYYWYYWYGFGGWYPYYPYTPVVYSYTTGSLIVDMVDMKAQVITQEGKDYKPIVWNAHAVGILTGDQQYDGSLAMEGLDQAFDQSPYLHK